MADDHSAGERHASWIELFFDLVLVAGIAQLAHVLSHGPSLADLGLYVLLYLAFWITWATFTVYGSVRGEKARILPMLLAMLGLAVMVASVPGVREEHTTAFVVAYIALRWLGGRIYGRTQIVVDWPLAQYGVGALPWLISIWAPDGARYWLWALGVGIDLYSLLAVSGTDMMRSAERKLDRLLQHRKLPAGMAVPKFEAAQAESGHLAERLGLFLIIVLGEGVIQVITSVSESTWTLALDAASLGAFVVLTLLWTLCLRQGFAGVLGLESGDLPRRHAMLLHCAAAGTLAAFATGLGMAIAHVDGPLPAAARWLLCGSLAGFFLVSAIGGLIVGATRHWLLGWALPAIVFPLLLATFGARLTPVWLIWLLAAPAAWQAVYATLLNRLAHPKTA